MWCDAYGMIWSGKGDLCDARKQVCHFFEQEVKVTQTCSVRRVNE
jgi:hypothetical protein